MSILFVVLALVGLFGFHLHKREGVRDDFTLLFVLALAGALMACSPADSAASTGHVDYGVSYDRGYMLLDVDVRGDDAVRELTLTWDAPITGYDMVDLCVSARPVDGGAGYTWFALPDAAHNACLLRDPGTTPLTAGKYVLTMEFKLHHDNSDPSLDRWLTPKLLSCKVSK